jgi:GNAT superfamily N-acetyltransferase
MILIRPGEPRDVGDVADIVTAVVGPGTSIAAPKHYRRLVAVDDGAMVGFLDGLFEQPVPWRRHLIAVHPGPQAFASWILVDPATQGRGVGKALLGAFLVEAQQHGCTYFAAKVSEADDPTSRVAFFRRCGLHDLNSDIPDDLVGAPISDILATLVE